MLCMSKKTEGGAPARGLASGQLWKLNHFYIHIVELGRKLIHYRMLSDLKEPGARIKTSGADVLWHYLQSRRAHLIQDGSRR